MPESNLLAVETYEVPTVDYLGVLLKDERHTGTLVTRIPNLYHTEAGPERAYTFSLLDTGQCITVPFCILIQLNGLPVDELESLGDVGAVAMDLDRDVAIVGTQDPEWCVPDVCAVLWRSSYGADAPENVEQTAIQAAPEPCGE